MSAQLIDGKSIATQIRQTVKEAVQQRLAAGRRPPGLAVIQVGNDPASEVYVANKRKSCQDVGFVSKAYDLPADTRQEQLLALIDQLNADPEIDEGQ